MAKKKVSAFRGKVSKNSEEQQKGSSFGYLNIPQGMKVYTPEAGKTESFDVVPYIVGTTKHPDMNKESGAAMQGEIWYKRPFKVHKDVGFDKERYVCLQSFGKKCPICEYKAKLQKEGADKDTLKAFSPTKRNLYAVIPRGIKKLEEEIHLFDMSQYLFQDLLNEEISENEEYEVFPDIEEGLTLAVRWTEETFAGHSFAQAGRIDFKTRKTAVDVDLEDVPCLDDCLKELSYKELELIFLEMNEAADEDNDEDNDDAPAKPISKKRKIVVEEDEDDDEEPEPVKKSTKKPAPAPAKKAKTPPALTWDDIAEMDCFELTEVAEARGLDVDTDEYDDDTVDEYRIAVALELEIEIPEDEPEPEPEPEPVKKSTKKPAPAPAKSTGALKCPSGHKFGVDVDKHSACDTCDLWDKCIDAK